MVKNVLGGVLQTCCTNPLTGFYRDGKCNSGPEDVGRHTVCVLVNDDFLRHQAALVILLRRVPSTDFRAESRRRVVRLCRAMESVVEAGVMAGEWKRRTREHSKWSPRNASEVRAQELSASAFPSVSLFRDSRTGQEKRGQQIDHPVHFTKFPS